MNFCHNCGYKLTLGNENFCPSCGVNIQQQKVAASDDSRRGDENIALVKINDTKQDVFGIGGSGFANITGKEISYNIQGNLIYLNNPSREDIEELENIKRAQITLDTTHKNKENKNVEKTQEVIQTRQQQTSQVLEEINRIEKKEGKEIQGIKSGNLHISKKELSLKEIILTGSEYYYKGDFNKALEFLNRIES